MLRKLDDIRGFTIAATDDEIGSVDDFYFDDKTWDIRYVVVDTGPWIFGRQVLVAPLAVRSLDWNTGILSVNLTKEQVENSPHIAADQPVSRQHEIDLHRHYEWPGYWYVAPGMTAPVASLGSAHAAPISPASIGAAEAPAQATSEVDRGDPHLRSAKEVLGYNIQATDGDIGHVEDFFAGENDWKIHYMMVDTRNWLPGRKVLVGTDWIERIDWIKQDLFVNITQEQVKDSPEYNPTTELTRTYEEDLHNYYRFKGYWY